MTLLGVASIPVTVGEESKDPIGIFATFNLFGLTVTESTGGLNQVDQVNKLFSNMQSSQAACACLPQCT